MTNLISRSAARRHCAGAALLLIVAGLLSACASREGDRSAAGSDGATTAGAGGSAGVSFFNVVVEDDVRLPMRDGIELGATLVRPDAAGAFPTLVFRTPYSKDSYARTAELPYKAARQGYAVFLVDVRGRYTSDGSFEAYRQEKADGYDTIEAIAAHPRSNGRIGTWGGSYPGFVQWLALSQDPPHLATAVPTMTPTSSHHFFYLGGAFNYTWFEWFLPSILPDLRRRAGDDSGPWDGRAAASEWEAEMHRWYRHRPLVDVPHMRRHAPYYYDWLTHPDETDWWRFVDVEADFEQMKVPVQLVTGWYDNTYGPVGAVRGFQGMRARAGSAEAREQTRLLIGPWTHTSLSVLRTRFGELDFGPSAGIDFDAHLLRWFDRRVKGVDNGVDNEPPVRIFVMGDNGWRDEQEFPPARAEITPLYLTADPVGESSAVRFGGLSFDAPGTASDDAASKNYLFDPADPLWDPHFETSGPFDQSIHELREDVLVYTSAPLAEDLEVTGEIVVELWVASDAPDTDFAVTVCDVHPDGTPYNLTGPEAGYLRMRYREGNDRQVLMEPGSVVQVRIGDILTSNVFKAGHRIRLLVTSSRAPHFDPNPNTGAEIATETRLVVARQTVFHDAARPSRILLPVIPREPEQ